MIEQSSEKTFNDEAAKFDEATWKNPSEYEIDCIFPAELTDSEIKEGEDFSWFEYRTGLKGWS